MRIIIDAFGGDNAPDEIIKGCRLAADELHVQIVLTGDEKKIRAAAEKLNVNVSDFEIIDCPDVITMEDEPTAITRAKKQSSMAVGLRALAEGKGDAFASAGNSGALVVGATLLVKRIKGVKRVAYAEGHGCSKAAHRPCKCRHGAAQGRRTAARGVCTAERKQRRPFHRQH